MTAASEVLGVTPDAALEAYGAYFAKHVEQEGYDNMLRVLGSNIAEFLRNLNNLHMHMAVAWPAINAPSFRVENVSGEEPSGVNGRTVSWPVDGPQEAAVEACERGRGTRDCNGALTSPADVNRPPLPQPPTAQVTPESLELHYYSQRPGLWPLVVGILKSMAGRYFGITQLDINLIAARHTGDCDHEVIS